MSGPLRRTLGYLAWWVLSVAAFAGYREVVWQPKHSALLALDEEVRTLTRWVKEARILAERRDELRQEIEKHEAASAALGSRDLDVGSLAEAAGLELLALTAEPERRRDFYWERPVKSTMAGTPADIEALECQILAVEPVAWIDGLRVERSGLGWFEATATVTTIAWTDD